MKFTLRLYFSFLLALVFAIIIGILLHERKSFYNSDNWNTEFIQPAEVDFNLNLYDTTQRGTFKKSFIYLTGTEECLPTNLATAHQIGDPNTCACDVMVLSFRVKCDRTSQGNQSHISYLFDPNTGWASARNVLLSAALNRRPGYHYYIFLNDDTVLEYNHFAPVNMRKISPFRALENWLMDYEPAVGVLDYTRHNGARVVLRKRRIKCGIKKISLVLPTVFFDAIFNAFHHKAVEHILPYPTRYEPHNWYCINVHTVTRVEVKFPGQALLFAPITAVNPIHRPYNRNKTNVPNIWRDYVKEIILEAPPKLQKHVVFKELRKHAAGLYGYLNQPLRTFCLNISRHQPIVPYKHLLSEV